MASIAAAVNFMTKIAQDDSHGYDQEKRNSPDYDCSSLVATALWEAGFKVSPYSWTGNLQMQLRACGFDDCKPPWKAGDIHLNEKHHVCMSINETQIAQASINEKGTVTGGETGDQTGKEIYICDYYEYRYGWDVHLRYEGAAIKKSTSEVANEVISGKWGNGEDRYTALKKAGYNPNEIQSEVNRILATEKIENNTNVDLTKIALACIKGQWGNGEERISRLARAGYSPEEVQKKVNKLIAENQY